MKKNWMNRILAVAMVCLLAAACLPLAAMATHDDCECEATKIVLDQTVVVVPYDEAAHGVTATVTDLAGNPIADAEAEVRYIGVSNNGQTNSYDSVEAPTEIGMYRAVATYTDDNGCLIAVNTGVIVIHSYWGAASVTAFEVPYVVAEYNGLPQGLAANTYNLCGEYVGEPVLFYVNVDEESNYTCSTSAPVDAGVYYVIAVYPGDDVYAGSYNIGKLVIKPYSGQAQFNIGDLTTYVGEAVDLTAVEYEGVELAERDVATLAAAMFCETEAHDAANVHVINTVVPESVQKNYLNPVVVNPGTHEVLELPTEPEPEPTEPEPTEPEEEVEPDNPKTGDTAPVVLMSGLLVVAVIGSTLLMVFKKRFL